MLSYRVFFTASLPHIPRMSYQARATLLSHVRSGACVVRRRRGAAAGGTASATLTFFMTVLLLFSVDAATPTTRAVLFSRHGASARASFFFQPLGRKLKWLRLRNRHQLLLFLLLVSGCGTTTTSFIIILHKLHLHLLFAGRVLIILFIFILFRRRRLEVAQHVEEGVHSATSS